MLFYYNISKATNSKKYKLNNFKKKPNYFIDKTCKHMKGSDGKNSGADSVHVINLFRSNE